MHQNLRTLSKPQNIYKSKYSPFYITYNPLLQRLIQSKLKMVIKEKPKSLHICSQNQFIKKQAKNSPPFITGAIKTLQVRSQTSQDTPKTRRSLVRFNQRPRTSATILRCRSEAQKKFYDVENFQQKEQSEEIMRSKTFTNRKKTNQRRQV